MFWGCFAGSEKGPGIFWEKEWGTISSETYRERIVPIIHGWLRLRPDLRLMQDNAKGHTANSTMQELLERGIIPIRWPAFSPDLNPIEAVWKLMKEWIQREYGERKWTYNELREAVIRAWEAITSEQLSKLIDSMHQRCLDVIEANGGHTKW
jgi:transposase